MWINEFETVPYGENGVHRFFYEPLPTCAPEEARPYCCLLNKVIFHKLPLTVEYGRYLAWDEVETKWDLLGQRWTDEDIGWSALAPLVWHEGHVYELSSGKVTRRNDQWVMERPARRLRENDPRLQSPLLRQEIAAAKEQTMSKTMEEQDKEIEEMEERFGGKWQELCLDLINAPAAQALDHLWREIILSKEPNYGDWEYPGQAYRHLLAEFKELKAGRDALLAACEKMINYRDRVGPISFQLEKADDFIRLMRVAVAAAKDCQP